MIKSGVTYRVTGLYKNGNKVAAYHLVGEDGSSSVESRDRMIYLISRGIVVNMRINTGTVTDENGITTKNIILRGKGVNLAALPVYDINNQQLKTIGASGNRTATSVSHESASNTMGQYEITKRIMLGNKCLGYEIKDHSGHLYRKSREVVFKLARKELISNAKAAVAEKDGVDIPILTGINCKLKDLPVLIIDSYGNIVESGKSTSTTIRAVAMNHPGIITLSTTHQIVNFKAGDIIICNIDGHISYMSYKDFMTKYIVDKNSKTATCDSYLDTISRYSIEIFGSSKVTLNAAIIKKWAIFKLK